MRSPRQLARVGLFALLLFAPASLIAAEWQPLLRNDLGGWRHWLGRPHASMDIPGLARDETGRYVDFIGWYADPTDVFRITEIDGGPVLHISGQIFGAIGV